MILKNAHRENPMGNIIENNTKARLSGFGLERKNKVIGQGVRACADT